LEVHEANLYMRILTVVSTVFRPLYLRELGLLAEELEQYADDKVEMRDVVSNCGSFLSEQNGKVYFVHLSAREYLSKEACQIMFPNGQGAVHFDILTRSRELLTKPNDHDTRATTDHESSHEDATTPELQFLGDSIYPQVFWVEHMKLALFELSRLQDGGLFHRFLQQYHLRWYGDITRGVADTTGLLFELKVM
jgi:hypothetical protein